MGLPGLSGLSGLSGLGMGQDAASHMLEFNGTTSGINCGTDASLDNLHDGQMTVEAWVNADTAGEAGVGRIVGRGNFTSSGWRLYWGTLQQVTANIQCVTTDAQQWSSTVGIPDLTGGWLHIAFTWDDATFTRPKLWIGGVQYADAGRGADRNGAVVADTGTTLYIGQNPDGNYTFDGKMAWLRISNNLRYTANFTPPPQCQPPAIDANTVEQWNFNEGEGAVAAAEVNAANNGTISNCVWYTCPNGTVTGYSWLSSPATIRSDMIAEIWSGNGLPAAGADSTSTGVADPLDSSPTNLLRVDQLTISMDDNAGTPVMASEPYIWYPAAIDSNGILALYHYGHTTGGWELGGQGDMVRALVEAGYTVAGFQMPAGGPAVHNTYPDPTASLNYLKFFVEPVIRTINELAAGFNSVYMLGLSGGGWTTVMCAAIDTRISRSVEVAGSEPLTITTSRDWEQLLPGLADQFDYQSIYVAGAAARRQMQLHNEDDSCCFTLAEYNTDPYEDEAEGGATLHGGSWSLVWDGTHEEHKISDWGRAQILAFFAAT